MASKPLSEYTGEELEAGLKKATSTGITLLIIFVLLFVVIFTYAQMNPEFKIIIPVIALIVGVFPAIGILAGSRSRFANELSKRKEQRGE